MVLKNKKKWLLPLTTAAIAMTLTGCSNNSSSGSSSGSSSSSSEQATADKQFPRKVSNTSKPIEGGTLNYGMVSDSPFTGIFNSNLSKSAADSTVAQFGNESLFKTNDDYKIIDGGAANLKLDIDAKTATVTINPNVKWSDGVPVTAKDVVYSYKMVANSGTQTTRYTGKLKNIEGIADYHDGKSDQISGITTPKGDDGNTVVIKFSNMTPGMSQSGNGYFLENASPEHYLKNVPFDKLVSSDEIRKRPLFFGPYKLSNLVAGQSAEWVPNEYYYGEKPKLAKITASVVSSANATQATLSNKYDIIDVRNSEWKEVQKAPNTEFIGDVGLGYGFLGFKVGKWDSQKGEAVMDSNSKMADKNLRQAIGYAMNIDQVNDKYSNGLSYRVKSLIPEKFNNFYDKNVQGYEYNIDKANKLLDEAGYKKNGEYRTDKNGQPLVINLGSSTGSSIQEPIIQNYIQQWKKIGLNVQLASGRLMEFNSYVEKVQNDDPGIDMFMLAWNLSSEPSPAGIYARTAPFNFTRFTSDEHDKLLADIDSKESFNAEHRQQAFFKWQEWMNDNAYVIPTSNAYGITAVNKRVVGYGLDSDSSWSTVGVSSN
ncbi:oligopeptide ABC transporter substrate-binding protein [Holzapfeliella sp. JNUCC 72]